MPPRWASPSSFARRWQACCSSARSLRCATSSKLPSAERGRGRLFPPLDLVLGARFAADADRRELDGTDVPDGWMGLDVGPRTAEAYAREVADAGTVFWNGPMGAFELEPFAAGARAVAEGVAKARGT